MGAKYTEGQKLAITNYMKDKHTIRVTVTKEKFDGYKKAAEHEGKSLSKFIIDCIESGMA